MTKSPLGKIYKVKTAKKQINELKTSARLPLGKSQLFEINFSPKVNVFYEIMDNRFFDFGNFAPYTFFLDHQNPANQLPVPPNPYQPYFNPFMSQCSFNG